MKKIFIVLTLLLTVLGSNIFAQNPEIYLEIVQDSASISRDSSFMVLLKVSSTSVNLKSYSAEIQFDVNLIKSHPGWVIMGDHLVQPPLNYTTFFDVRFSVDSGTIIIDGAVLEPSIVINGGGTLAEIKFESDAVNYGLCDIEFTTVLARDLNNNPLLYDPVNTAMQVCEWLLGDANGDGKVNVSDAVYIINYVFIIGFPPPIPVLKATLSHLLLGQSLNGHCF